MSASHMTLGKWRADELFLFYNNVFRLIIDIFRGHMPPERQSSRCAKLDEFEQQKEFEGNIGR